nr:hypothetical protein [Tanacetum cinerariifolium]
MDHHEDPKEDPKEDLSEEHEPEDDDEDPEEDPNEEHEPKDEDTKEEEPSKGSNETEPFEENKISVTPPPPRHRGARIFVKPQTPMTQTLIDAFAAGSPLFSLPPTGPTFDQEPLSESSAAAVAKAPKGQYDFVDTVVEGQGLIRSFGHNARTIARAADRVEDVGYVRALQSSEHRMMTFVKQVNLRDTVGTTRYTRDSHELYEVGQCQSAEDLAVTQMMHIHALEARARTDTTEKVDKYISGLPDNIHGNVMSARAKTLDDASELANDLMDKKLKDMQSYKHTREGRKD